MLKNMFVYKCVRDLSPFYITDLLTGYEPNRPLRPLGSGQLIVRGKVSATANKIVAFSLF